MALTELQRPTKESLYNAFKASANRWNSIDHQAQDLAEFIEWVDAEELDAIGVPSGQIRTDMVKFRTFLMEFESFMAGNAVTPTNVPRDVIDKVRTISS